MDLMETAVLMGSDDYQERFLAEYEQCRIRHDKLEAMLSAWKNGALSFSPSCPFELFSEQLSVMGRYRDILEERARIEGIPL